MKTSCTKRRGIGALMLVYLILAGCQTIQFRPAGQITEEDWPTDGGTSLRHRHVPEAPDPPLEMLWEYNASAGFGPGSPLIYQDALIVATRKGEVHVIDMDEGKKIGFKGFGDAIEGSPLISDRMLYVPSAWGSRVLMAYNLRRGTMKWRIRGVPFETALVDAGENVVGVDVEGSIRAHSKESGEEVWRMELGEYVSVEASPVVVPNGRMVVATDGGEVVMVDVVSGEMLWSTRVDAPVYETPAVSGRTIIIPTTRGTIAALNASNGNRLWTHDSGDVEVRFSSPATDGALAIIGTSGGRVIALDVSGGELLWETDVGEAITAPPLIGEDVVYAGTMGQRLLAFSTADGEMLWEHEVSGRIKSAMAARNGRLIILTDGRRVHMFGPVSDSIANLDSEGLK